MSNSQNHLSNEMVMKFNKITQYLKECKWKEFKESFNLLNDDEKKQYASTPIKDENKENNKKEVVLTPE